MRPTEFNWFTRNAGRARGGIVPLMILLLWQIISTRGWVSPLLLAPPGQVVAAFQELLKDGTLWSNLLVSLSRVV